MLVLYFPFCSVRKRGKYSGKSQPWPPFKQRGKIMDCYKAMYSILHCKTMHGFLFTVLNRVGLFMFVLNRKSLRFTYDLFMNIKLFTYLYV